MIALRLVQSLVAPGVIAHEGAHALACLITGTRIHEIRWFRFGDPAGYVVHDRARGAFKGVVIGFAPILFNAWLGAAIAYAPALKLLERLSGGAPQWSALDPALGWLGFVIALMAFPSQADAKAMWDAAGAARFGVLKRALVAPLWLLAQLLAFGQRWRLDALFALLACFAAPVWRLAREGRIVSPF